MSEATTEIVQNETPKKPYVFRELASTELFLMSKIIGAIGINEFKDILNSDGIADMIYSMAIKMSQESKDGEEEKNIVGGKDILVFGASAALDVANVIFCNLPKCEREIYQLLSQTSNLSVEQVKKLKMNVFAEMVIDFVKKEEFKDFFKVVSELFK